MPTSATTHQALLPAQRTAFDNLERAIAKERVGQLLGRSGSGKTTILRALHERLGGVILTTREFIEASANRHPLALDETVYAVIAGALRQHPAVLVDAGIPPGHYDNTGFIGEFRESKERKTTAETDFTDSPDMTDRFVNHMIPAATSEVFCERPRNAPLSHSVSLADRCAVTKQLSARGEWRNAPRGAIRSISKIRQIRCPLCLFDLCFPENPGRTQYCHRVYDA